MSARGKFQQLCTLALTCLGGVLGCVLGCVVDTDPHGGHAAHGEASGAVCPSDSELSYASFGADFLERYCVGCHSTALAPAERSGAPFGTDYDTLGALKASGIEHVDYVAAAGAAFENDFMPPGTFTAQPTREERLALGEWLACGAP